MHLILRFFLFVLPQAAIAQALYDHPYTFTTLAGDSSSGYADGTGGGARFTNPCSVAADHEGNIYVADSGNFTVRKVTQKGVVTTLAGAAGVRGGADGTGNAARFDMPWGLAVDSKGIIYLTDTGGTIRKLTPQGVVTTLAGLEGSFGSADGIGVTARFSSPQGIAVDSAFNLYIADSGNHTIRKVTSAGMVTTLAGMAGTSGDSDGTGSAARFSAPEGLVVDLAGNIYVADTGNRRIRKVTPAGVVTTLVRSSRTRGGDDIMNGSSMIGDPKSVAVDRTGTIYVADSAANTILRVTREGVVTTLAGLADNPGSEDGTGRSARFRWPEGVTVDGNGNIYVADAGNNMIRRITPAGVVTTVAGAPGASPRREVGMGSDAPQFEHAAGLAVDGAGNFYVADSAASTIRKLTPAGEATVLAGTAYRIGNTDGTGNAARFGKPSGLAADSKGNVYVADTDNNTIRKITPAGMVVTLAGLDDGGGNARGHGSAARFSRPYGVAVDGRGNVYVADTCNSLIRKVTPDGEVTTLAGTVKSQSSVDGIGAAAQFYMPYGVAADSAGNVYVADTHNSTIRKITPAGAVTTLAGLAGHPGRTEGPGDAARFWYPESLAVDHKGNVYVADWRDNSIRRITAEGMVTTLNEPAVQPGSVVFASNGEGAYESFNLAIDSKDNLYVAGVESDTIRRVGPAGNTVALNGSSEAGLWNQDGTGQAAGFDLAAGVAADQAGNLYVADEGSCTIRKVSPAGVVTTLAGLARHRGNASGTGSAARFCGPCGVSVDWRGNVYVADEGNNLIRKVTPAGVVSTLAGREGIPGSTDGAGSAAQFNHPRGVAVDGNSNLYVADSGNNMIRKVTAAGVVTTLAGAAGQRGGADGTGGGAQFDCPAGLALDRAGNIYVADLGGCTIRKVTPEGKTTTLAGTEYRSGSVDGTGPAAQFSHPYGVAVDGAGNVYVADSSNSTIRRVSPGGVVTTLAGLVGCRGSADGTGSAARFVGPCGLAVDGAGRIYVADLTRILSSK